MGFDFDAISNKFNCKIDRFLDSLSNNPSALGIAVSGGSDSLGLLYLINSWPNKRKLKIIVLTCLLYTSPSPRDRTRSRMPSSA